MSKNTQLRAGTRRIKNEGKMAKNKKSGFWATVWRVITWPFRAVWNWARGIDWVGLTNVALLIAIIVLFTILTIDIVKCIRCNPNVEVPVVADNVSETNGIYLGSKKMKLPLDKITPKWKTVEPVRVTKRGETTIDGDLPGERLTDNTQINGNLILQNMHRYTLPCGTEIKGNLIMRDVSLVSFCGKFIVNGDIYVSSRTSFGPIPRDAKVSGQVIF